MQHEAVALYRHRLKQPGSSAYYVGQKRENGDALIGWTRDMLGVARSRQVWI
jgi:hypothetical protein